MPCLRKEHVLGVNSSSGQQCWGGNFNPTGLGPTGSRRPHVEERASHRTQAVLAGSRVMHSGSATEQMGGHRRAWRASVSLGPDLEQMQQSWGDGSLAWHRRGGWVRAAPIRGGSAGEPSPVHTGSPRSSV